MLRKQQKVVPVDGMSHVETWISSTQLAAHVVARVEEQEEGLVEVKADHVGTGLVLGVHHARRGHSLDAEDVALGSNGTFLMKVGLEDLVVFVLDRLPSAVHVSMEGTDGKKAHEGHDEKHVGVCVCVCVCVRSH